MNSEENQNFIYSCLARLIALLIICSIGYLAVEYILDFFGKSATVWQTIVLSLVSSSIAIPTAISIWLLKFYEIL